MCDGGISTLTRGPTATPLLTGGASGDPRVIVPARTRPDVANSCAVGGRAIHRATGSGIGASKWRNSSRYKQAPCIVPMLAHIHDHTQCELMCPRQTFHHLDKPIRDRKTLKRSLRQNTPRNPRLLWMILDIFQFAHSRGEGIQPPGAAWWILDVRN